MAEDTVESKQIQDEMRKVWAEVQKQHTLLDQTNIATSQRLSVERELGKKYLTLENLAGRKNSIEYQIIDNMEKQLSAGEELKRIQEQTKRYPVAPGGEANVFGIAASAIRGQMGPLLGTLGTAGLAIGGTLAVLDAVKDRMYQLANVYERNARTAWDVNVAAGTLGTAEAINAAQLKTLWFQHGSLYIRQADFEKSLVEASGVIPGFAVAVQKGEAYTIDVMLAQQRLGASTRDAANMYGLLYGRTRDQERATDEYNKSLVIISDLYKGKVSVASAEMFRQLESATSSLIGVNVSSIQLSSFMSNLQKAGLNERLLADTATKLLGVPDMRGNAGLLALTGARMEGGRDRTVFENILVASRDTAESGRVRMEMFNQTIGSGAKSIDDLAGRMGMFGSVYGLNVGSSAAQLTAAAKAGTSVFDIQRVTQEDVKSLTRDTLKEVDKAQTGLVKATDAVTTFGSALVSNALLLKTSVAEIITAMGPMGVILTTNMRLMRGAGQTVLDIRR